MFFFFVDQPAGAFPKMSFVFLHEGLHCSENYTGKAGKCKISLSVILRCTTGDTKPVMETRTASKITDFGISN